MTRWRQRVRLEDGPKLDLNWLVQQGLVRPGSASRSTIRWSYQGTEREVASGRVSAEFAGDRRGWLRLELGALDQWIELEALPRHFGGQQWYFVCPTTRRLASVLWKPPGASRFASRQAWGRQVAYGSQFQTWNDRTLSRAQDIRCRLGGKDYSSLDGTTPPKPKGMHWRTYEAQLKRCEAYEMKFNLYLWRLIARLKK